MNKVQKIDQILALMEGRISPSEIGPRLVIHFNKGKENVYLINSKPVDRKVFHDLLRTLSAIGPLVTFGREDNNAEYYYD